MTQTNAFVLHMARLREFRWLYHGKMNRVDQRGTSKMGYLEILSFTGLYEEGGSDAMSVGDWTDDSRI